MTRQQAIERLQNLRRAIQIENNTFPTRAGRENIEAIEKAIEALEYMEAMIDDVR